MQYNKEGIYTLNISLEKHTVPQPTVFQALFCMCPFCFNCLPQSFTLFSTWQTPMNVSRLTINILSVKVFLSLQCQWECFSSGSRDIFLNPLYSTYYIYCNVSIYTSISRPRTLWGLIHASFIPTSSECSTGLGRQKVLYKYLLNRMDL